MAAISSPRLTKILNRHFPPLCPLARSVYDFSGTDELIERAAKSTRGWLERGGLEDSTIPGELQPHSH